MGSIKIGHNGGVLTTGSEGVALASTEDVRQLRKEIDEIRQSLKEPEVFYYSELDGVELKYSKEGDAGINIPIYDERFTNGELSTTGEYVLQPGQKLTVKTGVYLGVPQGWYAMVDTRSSTSKVALDLLCRTVDSPYRGNVRLALINLNSEPVVLKNGSEICQLVIKRHATAKLTKCTTIEEMTKLAGETSRGAAGFGSTGGGY
ncbi:deoxyuridine 5'-triphosphate nucleotidohydrolase [Bacillus phage vB_BsuM-Goe26]|nr:deoxyuridine 5'-triphosphate nucleotidohydrolase [Bacillus phage vB_BsuM-Goe26]